MKGDLRPSNKFFSSRLENNIHDSYIIFKSFLLMEHVMYKYLKSFARRTVIVATILSLSCASVIADDGPKIHPLAYMLYQRAFDPVTLKDFRNFLESVGVSGENLKMFTPKKPGWFSRWFGSPEVEVPELEEDINLSGFETSAGWKAYMAERSSQLNSAKLWALTTRSREALNFLITLAVSTTITLRLCEQNFS